MIKSIYITILIILFFSCSQENKIYEQSSYQHLHNIPNDNFIVPTIKGIRYYSVNYKSKILGPNWSCYFRFMYTDDKDDHYFSNTEIEVEYQSYVFSDDYNQFLPCFTIIGCKRLRHNFLSFVITWINNPKEDKDSKKTNTRIELSNEIDETTKIVYTTLDKEIIHELFPKFKGEYSQLHLDSITWNSTDPNHIEFFQSIKLHDFNLKQYIR